ncbi:DUF551 domain-containing protein [Escherichia coli]|nr:DUF551 domain-containing protein [Escherichia coli]EEW2344681.1 DUF551 domain-containing protein [Escherichia coli]EFN5574665.1 DUF551 domain-containing protein [Escherichia coli]EGO4939806.1 DUF551 domain-containing protein [Escherichia coli]EHA2810489.1 DUF551 domain-containing protein [Escherichia coli]
MTTITKERLLTIRQWRETYGPGSNVVLPAEEAEKLARIALASLEAEPVAYIFKHPAGKLFWALTDESNKEQADVIPVYAAAPASVVQDNASEPLAYAYKELTPEIMRNHLAVFERYGIAPNDSSTTIHALRIALDGIERSDAMLHGAEPVSQTYKLPVNTPCQDAPAHIWLQTAGVWPEDGELSELTWCSHNQHHDDTLYVRSDLVNGNYPVTPDGWISCSERMPNEEDVLVYCSDTKEQMVGFHKGKGLFQFFYMNGVEGVCEPSHWMPLPEPPQG